MTTIADSPTRRLTVDEFAALELDYPAELVRGEIVAMTRPEFRHGLVCGNVYLALRTWADREGKFLVAANDTGVVLQRTPATVRGPDVLAIQKSRVSAEELDSGWLTQAPELVVEVLSPSDRWGEVIQKSLEYLAAGIAEVWVVDPAQMIVTVFTPQAAPRSWRCGEWLTSEALLPGLRVEVAQFFASL